MLSIATLLILLAQAPDVKPAVTYFPSGVIDTYPRADHFIVQWFSGVLAQLNEPSLYQPADTEKNDSYRFTYLRAFHEPIVIRMTVMQDGSGELHVKRGARRKDEKHSDPPTEQAIHLTKEEVQTVVTRVEQSGFWDLPSQRVQNGVDGSDWVVEGLRQGNYHLVVRWCPPNAKFRDLCMYFLKLSKLKFSYREIY